MEKSSVLAVRDPVAVSWTLKNKINYWILFKHYVHIKYGPDMFCSACCKHSDKLISPLYSFRCWVENRLRWSEVRLLLDFPEVAAPLWLRSGCRSWRRCRSAGQWSVVEARKTIRKIYLWHTDHSIPFWKSDRFLLALSNYLKTGFT